MNRSILIVICDFLVSSMLAMMTGMVPAHTGGTGVGLDERTTRLLLSDLEMRQKELESLRARLREAAARMNKAPESDPQLKELTAKLVENMNRIEKVRKIQKATAANTGKLTAQQLQAKLEEEVRKRLEVEIKLKDQKADSKVLDKRLEETKENLKNERSRLARSEQLLMESLKSERRTNEKLQESSKKIAQMGLEAKIAERNLAEAKASAENAKAAAAAKEADLADVRKALREMNARVGQVTLERQELQNTLAYTSGKLNTAERDRADFRGQLTLLRRQYAAQNLKLQESQRGRVQMEELVKRSLKELSEIKKISDKNKENAVAAQAKLDTTEKLLKTAIVSKAPVNNAYSNYSNAAVRVTFNLQEKRLLLPQKVHAEFVLPLVKFGSKVLLPGPLEILTGKSGVALLYRDITALNYTCSVPGKNQIHPGGTYLLALRLPGNVMAAALEPNLAGRVPLKLLTRSQLAKRGTEGLFLFSFRKYGRESSELGSRCSLDMNPNSPYLLIRNARSGSAELNAEPGDFVLTREGEFVGVAIGYDKGNSKKSDVRVLLFEDPQVWNRSYRISLQKEKGEKYFERFGSAMQMLRADRPVRRRRK